MTDNDVIKLSRCFLDLETNIEGMNRTMHEALDIINRQQAEIERLTGLRNSDPMDFCGVLCEYSEGLISKAKSEARKEFAQRLKSIYLVHDGLRMVIDNLLEELDGKEDDNDT